MNIFKKVLLILLKGVAFLLIWFTIFILLALVAPTSEDGTMPALYALSILILPIVIAGLSMHPKLWKTVRSKVNNISINIAPAKIPSFKIPAPKIPISRKTSVPTEDISNKPKLPFSKKKRIEAAQALARKANREYSTALGANSPTLFVMYWNATISTLDELERYRGFVPDSSFVGAPIRFRVEKDFQWKLRDAMERSIKIVMTDLRGEHHNNKNGRFADYKASFECYSERYDDETLAYARSAVTDVAKAANVDSFTFCGEQINITQSEVIHNTNNLDNIDFMEGHEFEYWCANLLSDIGYTNVSVTQGSGDQGVDVLAQKNGIKYAIQCKCYSKDLGNSPIQEVASGKKIYHCNIGAVMTNRYFTKGAKEAAAANDVLLWDRDWIAKAILERNRH